MNIIFRGDSKTSLLCCVRYHGGGYITRLYSMFSLVSSTYRSILYNIYHIISKTRKVTYLYMLGREGPL